MALHFQPHKNGNFNQLLFRCCFKVLNLHSRVFMVLLVSTVTAQVLSKAVHLDGCRLRRALRDFRDATLAAARVVLYMDFLFPSKMDTLN